MLKSAGVFFEAINSRTDEETVKQVLLASQTPTRDIADALAELKALKISKKDPTALVIGSDQTLDLDGSLISKVATKEDAKTKLQRLRGKTHKLHSAVVLAQNGTPIWRVVQTAEMTMHDFSDSFIDDYLNVVGPNIFTSVGCYHYEADGSRLFLKTTGDYFVILGMPLLSVLAYLRQRGTIPK